MFKTVGKIIGSKRINSGVLFTIRLEDGTGRLFPYGLAVNSSMPHARRVAADKLAQLVMACGVVQLTDTEQLHDRLFVVNYEGSHITRIDAIVKPREALALRRLIDVSKPWWRKMLDWFANE